jgi:hypothetical protein
VNVTVTVSDSQASISQVLLYFSPDNWKTTNWETITPAQGSQVAHGRITNYPSGTIVEYYITAKDANGNSVTKNNGGNYYSYTVRWQPPPPGPLDQPLVTIPGLPVVITSGFLLIAVPTAIALSLVVYVRRRKRRKPANRNSAPVGSSGDLSS